MRWDMVGAGRWVYRLIQETGTNSRRFVSEDRFGMCCKYQIHNSLFIFSVNLFKLPVKKYCRKGNSKEKRNKIYFYISFCT